MKKGDPHVKCVRADILRKTEIEATLTNASPEMKALIGLLWGYGKRISENLMLQREDIFTDRGHLLVRFHVLKKRKKTDTLYLKALTLKHPAVQYILPYINSIQSGPLFPGLSRQNTLHRLKKLNPNSYLHLFRKSLATEMSEHSFTVQQLMDWFDWTEPDVAIGYVQRGPGLTKQLSDRTW